MSLNESPRASRLHIAVFGRRNAGKSSLINALARQEVSVVSPVQGTTTDPVYKSMELLPLGPVVLIDTAGLDDEGELGGQRKKKTMEVLYKTDVALLVIDALEGVTAYDEQIAGLLKERNIPVIGVLNKTDLLPVENADRAAAVQADTCRELFGFRFMPVSAAAQKGINHLRQTLSAAVPAEEDKFRIIGDLLAPGDLIVLVTPIDKAAPKGRLILPQQQTIRDILESDAVAVVTKEHELKLTLESLGRKPRLVVTDSQVFLKAAADTPPDVPLTSFSILFARHKGDLEELVRGARAIDRLRDGDKVLIAEPCTHHTQADDIGSVKLPRWIRQATGRTLEFHHANGMSFPDNVQDYALIVHCGGCMINRRQMLWRMEQSAASGVPIVNYGVAIAHVQGILERAISPFPLARLAWQEACAADRTRTVES